MGVEQFKRFTRDDEEEGIAQEAERRAMHPCESEAGGYGDFIAEMHTRGSSAAGYECGVALYVGAGQEGEKGLNCICTVMRRRKGFTGSSLHYRFWPPLLSWN